MKGETEVWDCVFCVLTCTTVGLYILLAPSGPRIWTLGVMYIHQLQSPDLLLSQRVSVLIRSIRYRPGI